jgi:deoxyribose-phosphate aldolase
MTNLKGIKKISINSLDLTSLNDNDTPDAIRELCQLAKTPLGHVAAVCVFPSFVRLAKDLLKDTDIQVATVVNFPTGNEALDEVVEQTKLALFDGADEIDVVFPYQYYLQGDKEYAINLIRAVKETCGNKLLKVILESGTFSSLETLCTASEDAIKAGADFLKTSTGKILQGATPEAVDVMLRVIKTLQAKQVVGIKISGGVRTTEDAENYIHQVEKIMGNDWISQRTFRIGASGLLNHLLQGVVSTENY